MVITVGRLVHVDICYTLTLSHSCGSVLLAARSPDSDEVELLAVSRLSSLVRKGKYILNPQDKAQECRRRQQSLNGGRGHAYASFSCRWGVNLGRSLDKCMEMKHLLCVLTLSSPKHPVDPVLSVPARGRNCTTCTVALADMLVLTRVDTGMPGTRRDAWFKIAPGEALVSQC